MDVQGEEEIPESKRTRLVGGLDVCEEIQMEKMRSRPGWPRRAGSLPKSSDSFSVPNRAITPLAGWWSWLGRTRCG